MILHMCIYPTQYVSGLQKVRGNANYEIIMQGFLMFCTKINLFLNFSMIILKFHVNVHRAHSHYCKSANSKRVNSNVEAQVWKGKWQLVSINTATQPARGNEHKIEYTQISVTWEKA